MFKFSLNFLLLSYSIIFFMTFAKANSACVFDENYFTEANYTTNKNIAKFVWIDSEKSAKGITENGDLFSIKNWACNHVGTHAVMITGPYVTDDTEFIRDKLLYLASIALEPYEANLVRKQLAKDVISVSLEKKQIYLNNEYYSEFYLGYSFINDLLIVEIKFYKN